MAAGIPGLPPELQAEAAAEVAAALKEKAGDGDALPAGIPESGNLPAAQVVKMSAEEKARLKAAREGVTPEGPEPPVEQSDPSETELPAPQDEDAQDAYAEYLKVCDEEIEFLRKQRKVAGPHAHEVALAVVDKDRVGFEVGDASRAATGKVSGGLLLELSGPGGPRFVAVYLALELL